MRRIALPSLIALLSAAPGVARADGAGDPLSLGALVLRSGLSLLAVLAVIAALAVLLKRLSGHAAARPRGGRLRSVARLDLGARREIRLVHADDRLLVVGVTADRIDLLTDLGATAPGADAAADALPPSLHVLRELATSP